MKRPSSLKGQIGWLAHRTFANYWLLAVTATVAAIPVSLALLWLDREFATSWLISGDLVPVATADTAKDFAGVAAGVNAAFITLYFSITLIVLSMAAGNLGVRLIDRWLKRIQVRISLAGLSFTLVVSLIAMMAIDAEAALENTPLLTVLAVMVLQAINVAMLAVSLHQLGRTMFVDDSIDDLAQDSNTRSIALTSVAAQPSSGDEHELLAPREGYVEDVDVDALVRLFGQSAKRVTVHAAPGQHVVEGEPLLSSDCQFDDKAAARAIPIGPFRSDNQGVVFRVRLIVEIAARALSPAINDFYTALTCADKLATVIESQTGTWVDSDHLPARADHPWLVLTGQDFRGVFSDPLSAFRQAACQYPSVAIRMIDNYARIARRRAHNDAPDGLVAFLREMAESLCRHAASQATYEGDRADIEAAFENGFADLTAGRERSLD